VYLGLVEKRGKSTIIANIARGVCRFMKSMVNIMLDYGKSWLLEV